MTISTQGTFSVQHSGNLKYYVSDNGVSKNNPLGTGWTENYRNAFNKISKHFTKNNLLRLIISLHSNFNSFFLFLTSGKRAVTDFKAPSITWVFGSFSLPLILSPKLQCTSGRTQLSWLCLKPSRLKIPSPKQRYSLQYSLSTEGPDEMNMENVRQVFKKL